MTQQQVLRKIDNILYLPTVAELKTAFPLKDSYPTDSKEFAWLDPKFAEFQHFHCNYQVYTQEFIKSLASYLEKRIRAIYQATHKTVVILEVGAGDGRLTYFLQKHLESLVQAGQVQLRATDSKDWENKSKTNPSLQAVEQLDYLAAIKTTKSNPTLVIACWMNINVDWTPQFRKAAQVFEYMLIGDLFRTAKSGAGWYLPKQSGFTCKKLTQIKTSTGKTIIQGSRGRFDGSPFNKCSRTEVYAFVRR